LKVISIILFIFISITALKAEVIDSLIKVKYDTNEISVVSIIITGNKITREHIIRREMETKEGDNLDIDVLKEDWNNINNLGLFNRVNISPLPDTKRSKINILIDVEESIFIIPLPQAGIKEGSFKKIWGGLKLTWKNFRGLNETIGADFGIGYEPFISLSYFNPWITEKSRFFGGFGFKFNKSIKKDVEKNNSILKDETDEYNVFSYSGNLNVGKYLFKYFSLSADYAYNYINIPDVKNERSLSPDGKDIFSMLSVNMLFEKRDNISFTLNGTSLFLKYSKYGLFNQIIDYNRFEINVKKYISVKISADYFISYAFWIRAVSNFGGSVPKYMKEVYGYDVYIRGWKDYLFQGDNSLGYFSEIRIPIIKPFYVKGIEHFVLKSIPFFREFTYEYGLYITPFFDIGSVFEHNKPLKSYQFRNGYGLGFIIILPFNFIARIDLAFNKEIKIFKSRFSFDLEAYF